MRALMLPALFSLICLIPDLAIAQSVPEVTLSARLIRGGRNLSIGISPSSSAANCNYALVASPSRSRLSSGRGTQVAALVGESFASLLTTSTIKLLGSTRGRPLPSRSVYFQVRSTCGTELGSSALLRIQLPRTNSGGVSSASKWIAQLTSKLSPANPQLTQVFSEVNFSSPIDLQATKDGTDRVYVAQQAGTILVLDTKNPSAAASFLDVSSLIITGGERGLLGMAFHPKYKRNGKLYLNYTRSGDGATVISEFTRNSANSNVADLSSERILLTVAQPASNHNGGSLAFGKDGFLYIALGDGGGSGDPSGNGQNRASLLGKILRIDVDRKTSSTAYAIPSSNPFRNNKSGFKEEIYAYGLRNPWRISFDSSTNDLWAGDVGQGAREEVDLIKRGKNYGWNTMEGFLCFSPSSGCDTSGLTLPITDYPRNLGASITGGYVYRGKQKPALTGLYVYGDFISGRIWGLDYSQKKATVLNLFDTSINISSFGLDEDGELYLLDYTGKILKFQ